MEEQMIHTEMREQTDNTLNPPVQHPTLEAAIGYAERRSGEKKCEITVVEDGRPVGFYIGGELQVQAEPLPNDE
jgi:hypothetical protein